MPWIDDRGVSVAHHRPIPQSVESPKEQICSRCGAERRVFSKFRFCLSPFTLVLCGAHDAHDAHGIRCCVTVG